MKHRGGYQKRNAAEPETVMDEAQRNAAEQMLRDLGAGPEDEAPAEETAEAAVSAVGDWRVCTPPVGFFWGGTWLMGREGTAHAEAVAEIIEWVTLDTSETGLQYLWANDLMGNGAKDTVASAVVMGKSDGTLAFCGGQNIFPTFIAGNANASGKGMTQYDATINTYFTDAAGQYAEGNLDRDAAIETFKTNVADNLSF